MSRIFILALIVVTATACTSELTDEIRRAQGKAAPILITSLSPSQPNSAGGVSVSAQFINTSSQIIKYVRFHVTPYNRVGDVAPSEIGKKTTAVLTQVGPIEPRQAAGQFEEWSNVWYNHAIQCIKLEKVDVIYMTGGEQERTGSDALELLATDLSPSKLCRTSLY